MSKLERISFSLGHPAEHTKAGWKLEIASIELTFHG